MEVEDLNYEFERDRSEYLATIRRQQRDLQLLNVRHSCDVFRCIRHPYLAALLCFVGAFRVLFIAL